MENDQIYSAEHGPEVETIVKGSRFLGELFPLNEPGEVKEALEQVRLAYPDASHHCWGYRYGDPQSVRELCDDDGEPNSTAGTPILNALQHADLYNVFVVVTRYFGGTKLGKGGLVRAYGDCAREAIAAAPRRIIWRRRSLEISCEYDDLGPIEAILAKRSDEIFAVERSFDPQPRILIEFKASQLDSLRDLFVDATSGRCKVIDPEADGA